MDLTQIPDPGRAVGPHADAPSALGAPDAACACGGAGECCASGDCALAELGHDECAVVQANELPAREAALLRAMGLRESTRLRVCRRGQPCIVEVAGAGGSSCRVGIAKELALRVIVRRESAPGA